MSSPQQQQPGGALRRESPTTPYGGGGVAVDAGRRRAGQGLPSHAAGRGGVGIAEEAAPARYPVQSILGAVPMADAVNAASAAAGTSATGAAPAVGVSTPGAAAGTAHYVMPAPVRGPNPFDLRGDAPGQAAGAGTPPRASVVAQPQPARQEYAERPSAAREASEMMPQADPAVQQEQVDVLRRTTDNTAGYDAGTASRGGGSGGTTEAMTGGVAAGSGLGDERRAGMGELERGQM